MKNILIILAFLIVISGYAFAKENEAVQNSNDVIRIQCKGDQIRRTKNNEVAGTIFTFTLKDGKYTLKNGTDYTVTYENNTAIGTARVWVNGKGNYAGTTTFTFVINPASMAAPTLKTTASVKQTTIIVSWKKATGSVSGYEISYRKSGSSSWKTIKVAGGSKTSYKITSGLSRLTKYDVRVRAYKTVGKATYYGSWSSVKTVRTPVLK